MDETCSVCNEELESDDNVFECDGCTTSFHLRCGGATKKDAEARKKSKCLRLYCTLCVANPAMCVAENVKTVMKFVHKIDLFNQKQVEINTKVNDILSNTAEKVNEMSEKLESFGSSDSKSAQSKSSRATKTNVNPVVVVKPKEKQASKKTVEEIRKKVDKNVKVCNARNIKDGGVVLSCENSNDTMKVKKIVEDSYGANYEVSLPEAKKPRVRITNVSDQIEKDKLIDEIKKMNAELKNFDMKLVTVIDKKKYSYTYRDIVIEVDGAAYKKLLKMGVIFLDWRECAISEHLHLQRCFKCCGFSHISTECKSETQKCSKCAGNHKYDSCNRKKLKCINCSSIVDKFGADIDTNHHAWSKDCKVLQRKLQALKNKIEYNTRK